MKRSKVEADLLNSIKVALISEEFPPFMFGGIGSACYDYAMVLSKKGVKTTVFCGKSKEVSNEQVNNNLEVVRLPCFEVPPRFLWFQLQNIKYLSNTLRDYSVIHVFNPQAGAISALLKKSLEKPLLTSIHGLHLTSLKVSLASPSDNWNVKDIGFQIAGYPLQYLLHAICLQNSDHIAVCNYSTAFELKKMFSHIDPAKISVIYNGINFDDVKSINTRRTKPWSYNLLRSFILVERSNLLYKCAFKTEAYSPRFYRRNIWRWTAKK